MVFVLFAIECCKNNSLILPFTTNSIICFILYFIAILSLCDIARSMRHDFTYVNYKKTLVTICYALSTIFLIIVYSYMIILFFYDMYKTHNS